MKWSMSELDALKLLTVPGHDPEGRWWDALHPVARMAIIQDINASAGMRP